MSAEAEDVRRLLLMRHAKAEAGGADDHARDLTERGRRDAAETGSWLRDQGLVPTHALVSSAARTTQTWLELAAASGSTARPDLDDALYAAGPDSALEVIRAATAQAATLLVVAHNPTVAHLAQLLSDGLADATALRDMAHGYPPAAVTVLELSGPWAELGEGGARVTAFHVGQG